jgi:hypothetical protein
MPEKKKRGANWQMCQPRFAKPKPPKPDKVSDWLNRPREGFTNHFGEKYATWLSTGKTSWSDR